MTTEPDNHSARVAIESEASVEAAFDALVRTDQLARWFGTPTAALDAGGPARIEFGDGDFFAVDQIELVRPTRVRYAWRFLGLGAQSAITWTIARRGTRTKVTVTDDQPGRSDDELDAMRQGWHDFLDRLARYLATGAHTRYDWRREIDGGVDLACGVREASARLFAVDALARWQPWRATAWKPGARLQVDGGRGPATLELVELERDEARLRLAVTAAEWKHPTHCELALAPRGTGARLTMSHRGWDQIAPDDELQRGQRERFCGLWIESLRRAQALGGAA